MTKNKNLTINNLLLNKHLIYGALPSIEDILNNIIKDKFIKLVYGETYDQYGPTIDSLKYYFFITILNNLLKGKGIKATSSVIIGDLHSVKNRIVKNKSNLLASANSRLHFVEKIRQTYNLNINPILMSELFNDFDFKQRLRKITPIFQKSEHLKNIARKTVLKNKITQEEKIGFQYTLEEVALITGFNIKIGPPREIYYDQLARIFSKELGNKDFFGLYLKPTYPIGLGFDFFVTHPEIEKYGITPYKAGSNQLQNNRIILGITGLMECKKLIDSSFVAKNSSLPNPVLDIYLISKMAGYFLQNKELFFDNTVIENPELLRKMAFKELEQNIYIPLNLK